MQFRRFFVVVLLYGLLLSRVEVSLSQEPPGSLDKSFFTNGGTDGTVRAITIQPDGRILIGGFFGHYYGVVRNKLARVLSNGSVDPSFDSPITDPVANVYAIAAQTNGQIVVGLDAAVSLMRLSSTGTLDSTFNIGAAPDGAVHAITIQPDGKILIGGAFMRLGIQQRPRIARLNSDGTVDASFNSLSGADYIVEAIVLQPDGKVLIAGQFHNYAGVPRSGIARLNSTGSIDATFTPGQGANESVFTLAVQPDGKPIIGGFFNVYDGHPQNAVARLNTNGTYDATFQSVDDLAEGTVSAMEIQRDGKIVVAGDMTLAHMIRLNTDGTVDDTYQPSLGPGDDVYAMAIQSDQKVLIGGLFESVDVYAAFHIARINADLKLLSPIKAGSAFSTQIQTVSGKSYWLEYTLSLDQPWSRILSSEVTGDGTVKLIRDTSATGTPRFYRVFGTAD